MHDYLRAIGFSGIDKAELKKILKSVADEPKYEYVTDNGVDSAVGEKSKDFAERVGITLRGEYDEHVEFSYEYYFPYIKGDEVSVIEEISVEKHADRTSYVGISDNVNLGVSLAFYLLNMVDYVDHVHKVRHDHAIKPVILSALSLSGKILLPIYKDEEDVRRRNSDQKTRNSLINAAKQGDQEAIENLTLEDLDLFSAVSKRARKEDVLSIVESYFMPFGIACDEYSVLGTIIDFEDTVNSYTGEELCLLKLECNDLIFDVCINKKDLFGEPAIGRRFKGNIWMQGCVEFMTV